MRVNTHRVLWKTYMAENGRRLGRTLLDHQGSRVGQIMESAPHEDWARRSSEPSRSVGTTSVPAPCGQQTASHQPASTICSIRPEEVLKDVWDN
jgi:hypothetical protein